MAKIFALSESIHEGACICRGQYLPSVTARNRTLRDARQQDVTVRLLMCERFLRTHHRSAACGLHCTRALRCLRVLLAASLYGLLALSCSPNTDAAGPTAPRATPAYATSLGHACLRHACLRDACLPARCAATPRPRDSSNLPPCATCDPVRLCTYALSAPQQAAHTAWRAISALPPVPSQSFPAPSPQKASDFPNTQLQGLRPAFATTRLPMRPAFTHRIQTIQPALLIAQMNDMPLDLSQSDLQARRGRTRTL